MFGAASGLMVNLNKCDVYPISCDGINVSEVMQAFPCSVREFPCSYLGLPLHTRPLRRVDIQPLIDKIANRLPSWKARLINKAGRLKLVNTVLSSMPVYFMTVFDIKKWAIKKIDKLRRGFLWKGTSEAKGVHCQVAWERVKCPKPLGGLGVLDLERFGRALRLRWLWFAWTDPDRPWVGSEVPCNTLDRQLFRCSTSVTIGDGKRALFWDSAWFHGHAPRDVAPNLYKLAWRKRLMVRDEVDNQTWTRGLWRMSNATEIAEFIVFWEAVQDIHFSDTPDKIVWKWTANGKYTSASAYAIQFAGRMCPFNATAIWKAKTEGKHRFFTWLLVQERLHTADVLLLKGVQCNPVCSLCDQQQGTAAHLCLHCPYVREVWWHVQEWTEGLIHIPDPGLTIQEWWNSSVLAVPRQLRTRVAAIYMYTAWNIWNERNRRTFRGVSLPSLSLLPLIKAEMEVRRQACEVREVG